jgi:DNA modification methylase
VSATNPTVAQYRAFLQQKILLAKEAGFSVAESEIHPVLMPHQRAIVRWAMHGGRRAIFASFGLGKSLMQLEIVRQTMLRNPDKRALIVCPLGVRQEFMRDAALIGIEGAVRFVRRSEEVDAPGIYLTNYESVRDGKLDPNLFIVASLDEAAAMRSSNSKTYHSFLSLFAGVRFRFVATATPSPNDYIELLNYAGFLGIADKAQLKTRFFDRDAQHADTLTLKANMREEFWFWIHSWAVFLQKPSDLGFDDTGYSLPPLNVHYHEIESDHATALVDSRGQGKMFRDSGAGVSQAAAEKRDSLAGRIEKMREILAQTEETEPGAHWIIWHDLEAERHAVQAAVPESRAVYGTQELEEREDRIIGFSDGEFRIFSSKPVVAGSGCNFQRHCHRAIFLGIGYKFHDFIQSIHRIYRFQQSHPCEIHIIHTEAERPVLSILQDKWAKHDETVAEMGAIIREFGLDGDAMAKSLTRRIGCERREIRGDLFRAINADSVEEALDIPTDSMDMILTSIPFGTQYEYSANYNDFGHNEDNESFFRQMDFLSPQLLRILKPGRIFACHVKDRVNFGNYSGDCIHHFRRHGFVYMGMITVVTDVVKENNQSYRLGWTEQCKDGTKMGVGSPEYVLLFRKIPTDRSNSYADDPVTRAKTTYTRARWQIDAHALWRSSGQRLLTIDEIAELPPDLIPRAFAIYSIEAPYDYEAHVRLGEILESRVKLSSNFMVLAPAIGDNCEDVWTDVVRQLTLNGAQTQRGLNNHICPLQWDIVDRLIDRFTNPGETIFDPFAGLFTVPYRAIKFGRKGVGIELSPEYFDDGIRHCLAAEMERGQTSLDFGMAGMEATA